MPFIKKAKDVKDLAYFRKELLRKVAREQFEKLERLGLKFPIIATR